MPTGNLLRLQQALKLPGASLQTQYLPDAELNLLLLQLQDTQLQLDAGQIADFWQQLPYWAFAWAGGRALAQWLRHNPQAVMGKRVLDFGCGSAMVGIAAAKAGAKEVWMADLDSNALEVAQYNAMLNGVVVKPVTSQHWPEVDMLLASDVLYDISSSADLQNLMCSISDWILAESQYVKPNFVTLKKMHSYCCSTLPQLGDFDEQINIEIYGRA